MAPSKKQTSGEDKTSLANIARLLKSQAEQLTALSARMAKVDKIETDVDNLRTLIVALLDENKELKIQVKEKEKKIEEMGKSIAGLEDK